MIDFRVTQSEETHWEIRSVDGGLVTGAQCLRRWTDCYCVGILHGLVVIPDRRRQGLATALVERAETLAAQNGIALLYSTVIASNTASRGTLEKRGFRAVSECHNPKSGNDLVVYAKNIPNAVYVPRESEE